MHHVFLIPGFFGFANFGDIKYFSHVREVLSEAIEKLGEKTEIHYVRTLPTASLLHRASSVANAIAESGAGDDEPIHLVGHSTGGLDARLFTSPGVILPSPHAIEPLARRVRSIVSVATPHSGTPQASLFASLAGQQLLRVLSVLTLHGIRLGSMPLPALVALAGVLPRLGQMQGPVLSILDQVYRQLLKDFDQDRRAELEQFVSATTQDQTLLPQLASECLELLNATAPDRPTTRYGCVITQARAPSIRSTLDVGLSPTGQAVYALYRALYELGAGMPEEAMPALTSAQTQRLIHGYGGLPDARCNDAIVPTRSQIWGDIIHAAWADHLDVIGHFTGPEQDPPHIDWLATQTRFNRAKFEVLWSDIAGFLVGAASPQ